MDHPHLSQGSWSSVARRVQGGTSCFYWLWKLFKLLLLTSSSPAMIVCACAGTHDPGGPAGVPGQPHQAGGTDDGRGPHCRIFYPQLLRARRTAPPLGRLSLRSRLQAPAVAPHGSCQHAPAQRQGGLALVLIISWDLIFASEHSWSACVQRRYVYCVHAEFMQPRNDFNISSACCILLNWYQVT